MNAKDCEQSQEALVRRAIPVQIRVITPIDELMEAHNQMVAARRAINASIDQDSDDSDDEVEQHSLYVTIGDDDMSTDSDQSVYLMQHEFNFSRIDAFLSSSKLNNKELTTYPIPDFSNSSWINIDQSASDKLIIVINSILDEQILM